uniref:Putative secreted protein n=1 Tax=Anopheles triannulatus TaxID=58253 RepID=A0A2M4B384_9DIPT
MIPPPPPPVVLLLAVLPLHLGLPEGTVVAGRPHRITPVRVVAAEETWTVTLVLVLVVTRTCSTRKIDNNLPWIPILVKRNVIKKSAMRRAWRHRSIAGPYPSKEHHHPRCRYRSPLASIHLHCHYLQHLHHKFLPAWVAIIDRSV